MSFEPNRPHSLHRFRPRAKGAIQVREPKQGRFLASTQSLYR